MEDRITGKPRKTIVDAVRAFHALHDDRAPETKRKYKRLLGYFSDFCLKESVHYVDQADVEVMDHYTLWRNKTNWTWIKEIELLRQFFEFCRDREWTLKNPARSLKRPSMHDANEVVPYTQDEIVKILRACDLIGRCSYERFRARARALLMRFAGLRISDVVTLSRDHIHGTRLEKRAVKNHRWIRVELPRVVLEALDRLPRPKNAAQDCHFFFASGNASVRSLVKGAQRAMASVVQRSGVERAHCHRFRHTLASELLGKGWAIEDVANVLGDSPATIRRHYAKWTREHELRQKRMMRAFHGTNLARAEVQVSN
jgi:integrase